MMLAVESAFKSGHRLWRGLERISCPLKNLNVGHFVLRVSHSKDPKICFNDKVAISFLDTDQQQQREAQPIKS